jgi:peptide/nickel transport system permease protein
VGEIASSISPADVTTRLGQDRVLAFVTRRLIQGFIIFILVSVGTFGLMHMSPGDPIDMLVGDAELTDEQILAIQRRWGLDRPWYEQYMIWFGNMLRGDLGISVYRDGAPVNRLIREAAPATIQLNLLALAISIGVAIPVGIIAAVRRYSLLDYATMIGSTLGVALPNFWLALMAIIVFALYLGWLPSYGLANWKGFVLPAAVLATEQMAVLARMMRSTTIEVLNQDYVVTAKAKGLATNVVLVRHAVRNALLPVISVLGYRIAFLLSGTIIVETIFGIGGLGRLFMSSILNLDYQVVQAIVLLFTVTVIIGNLVTDLIYGVIDPRIRVS